LEYSRVSGEVAEPTSFAVAREEIGKRIRENKR